MKVKALKLFGDGKRLYEEGEIAEMSSGEVEILNSTSNGPLVEIITEITSKGADTDGNDRTNTKSSKGKARDKYNS